MVNRLPSVTLIYYWQYLSEGNLRGTVTSTSSCQKAFPFTLNSHLSFSSLMWRISFLSPSFPRSLSSLLSTPLAQLEPAGKPEGPPCRRHGSWWLEVGKLADESLGPNMEPAADHGHIMLEKETLSNHCGSFTRVASNISVYAWI